MKWFTKASIAGALGLTLAVGALWLYAGAFGFHVLFRHGPVQAQSTTNGMRSPRVAQRQGECDRMVIPLSNHIVK